MFSALHLLLCATLAVGQGTLPRLFQRVSEDNVQLVFMLDLHEQAPDNALLCGKVRAGEGRARCWVSGG